MVRVFIVEDNLRHMATMEAKVEELGFQVAGKSNNGKLALEHFKQTHADVVLMDINLDEEEEGIALAGKMKAQTDVPIIFVTAMASDDVIKRAIGTSPSGYLAKPVDPVELKANIELAIQQVKPIPAAKPLQEYITVRMGQKLQKTYFKDITHLAVESKNYVTLMDKQQRRSVVRGSLRNLLECVLPSDFMRTHYSYAINLTYVEYIDESTQELHLSTGESIPIGKMFKKDVYKRMNIA